MEYTKNYQLPKWAMTDRIQMEDFNSMTGRLDTALTQQAAALSAETSSRETAMEAVNTELAKKCAFVKLKEQNISSAQDKVNVYVTGIDWSRWQNIHIDICANKLTTITLKLNGSDTNATFLCRNALNNFDKTIANVDTSTEPGVFAERVTLCPGCQPKRKICASFAGGDGIATITYEQLSYIQFGGGFAAGGKIIIWGEA